MEVQKWLTNLKNLFKSMHHSNRAWHLIDIKRPGLDDDPLHIEIEKRLQIRSVRGLTFNTSGEEPKRNRSKMTNPTRHIENKKLDQAFQKWQTRPDISKMTNPTKHFKNEKHGQTFQKWKIQPDISNETMSSSTKHSWYGGYVLTGLVSGTKGIGGCRHIANEK